jgi:hypothetical protein
MSDYDGSSYHADEAYSEMSEQQRELIDTFFDVYNDSDADDAVETPRRNKKNDELLKTMDKGFAILYPRSKNPIAYFHTDTNPGSTIRNALTGQYESGFKFGSANEDLFFKVNQKSPTSSDMHILFYDSPEQYEKHFRTTIQDAAVKGKWSDKSARRRKEFTAIQDRRLANVATIVR